MASVGSGKAELFMDEPGRGARVVLFFARTCQASHVALLGDSPVEKVIANFVLAKNKTTRPKHFFTSRTEAMAWLMKRTNA